MGNSRKQTTKESSTNKTANTMKQFLSFLLLSPGFSAPQYGQTSVEQPPVRAPAQQSGGCRTESEVVWDTQYIETESQECSNIEVPRCSTQYKDEVEYYTETECKTEYKEDCEYQWEGSGYNKVWAPIPGTCKNNAYYNCGDVQKQKLKQVPNQDCQNVPNQVCKKVPKQE